MPNSLEESARKFHFLFYLIPAAERLFGKKRPRGNNISPGIAIGIMQAKNM
jgi:hypothetical protein